jgi:uncharacterized protein (TIGR03067 family)
VTTSLLVGLALVVGAPAKKDAPPKDPPTLIGEWIGESGVRGGKPENPPPGTTLTFLADGKLRFKEGKDGKSEEGAYNADAKKSPSEIDITPPEAAKGETLLGIYKIEGDTLTLCFAMGGERPKEFAAPAGSEVMLVTCKRVKKD